MSFEQVNKIIRFESFIWQHVADLLEAGFPILIYAGEFDFICNWSSFSQLFD